MKLREGEYIPATCQLHAPVAPGALLLVCQRVLECKRCGLCLVHCTCTVRLEPKPKVRRKRMPEPRLAFEDAGDQNADA